ncbi:MAG: carbon starvation protein A [Gemmatimonadaceae bacterium]|nr:carbon starvation protein A [Gemmatimonadaceae bacterium]
MPILRKLTWVAIAVVGAATLGYVAVSRGETIGAGWLLTAAVCIYLIAYRFHSRIIAAKIFALDPNRATPAVRLADGRDYVPTNKWIAFGHHFAAIAGPGPLLGPTLAAQFGYLPGFLWIVVGVVLGGAVQDCIILCASIRRDGKSLGQMAKEEIGSVAGYTALVATFGIMIVMISVLALVVVNALKSSPWGTFTLMLTIPIAILMGVYLRWIRPGRVLEATGIGLALLFFSLFAGKWVAQDPALAATFTLTGQQLSVWMMIYGFFASVLPVWFLLAPRDYLSAFVKIGVVAGLGVAVFVLLPSMQMPATTTFFTTGEGPVFAGKVFPFVFITIACGAISGFHSLVCSGTTPKLVEDETDARLIGYGGMLTESLVAVLALIAASVLEPGAYFAINAPAGIIGTTVQSAAEWATNAGFAITPERLNELAARVQESSLLSRTGGAPSLAVGMANILSGVFGKGDATAIWYHFAIMFEALFVLTTLDAGTRVGRFMLQDMGSHVWKPFGRVSWQPAAITASAIVVLLWGYFLYQGVNDPLGGVNTLWPLFGISNQLLAVIALCVGTTVILKMGKARYMAFTVVPLTWLAVVNLTAGFEKIFGAEPRLGFLAHARWFQGFLDSGQVPPGVANAGVAARMIFNDRVDAGVTAFFLCSVLVILAASMKEWYAVLSGAKEPVSTEIPFTPRTALSQSP